MGIRLEMRGQKAFWTALLGVTGLLVISPFLVTPKGGNSRGAPSLRCFSHVRMLGLGLQMYASDHDDALPVALVAASPSGAVRPTAVGWGWWIRPYVKNDADFACPLDEDGGRLGYARNANTVEFPRLAAASDPARSVLLYEVSGTLRLTREEPFSEALARAPTGDGAAGGLLDSALPLVPPAARPATGPLANSGLSPNLEPRHGRGSNFALLDGHARFFRPGEVSAGANALAPGRAERPNGCARPDLPNVDRPCAEGAGRKGRAATFSLR